MKLFLILSISFICSACTILGDSKSMVSKQSSVCLWPQETAPPVIIEAEIIRTYRTRDGKEWSGCDIKPIRVLKNELPEKLKSEIKVGGYGKDFGMNQKYILGLAYCSNPGLGYKFEIVNIMKVSLVKTANDVRTAISKGPAVGCALFLITDPPVVIEAEVTRINQTYDGKTCYGYDIRPIKVIKNDLEEKLNSEIKVVFSNEDYFRLKNNQKYVLGLDYYYKPQSEYKFKIENLMKVTANKTINRK